MESLARTSFLVVRQVDLKVEAVFPGREIDRRVLNTDVDAEVGLNTCEWCGVGQRARLSIPEVAHGFGLIPDSVAG